MSTRDYGLYLYAIGRWASVIIEHAAWHGRGWYQFADGQVWCASEVVL